MTIYEVMIGVTLLIYLGLRYILYYDKSRVDRITIVFFFVSYLLLLCLRDISVGIDTISYFERYVKIQMYSWTELFEYDDAGGEIGFLCLNKLVGTFGNFRLLLIVVSSAVVIPVTYLYTKESEGAIFTISFFLISLLFSMFFSGMRQSIAIAFGVPAYFFVKQKSILPFICMVICACLFHKTGVVIGLLYPVFYAKITRKWLWFIVPLMIAIYYYRNQVFGFIMHFSEDTSYESYSMLTGESGQWALSLLFILLSCYSYIVLDEKKSTQDDIGLRNILLLATCIHMFSTVNPVAARITMYYILFIPIAITRINNRSKDVFSPLTLLASIIMSFYFVLHFVISTGDTLQVKDYHFLW